MAETKKTSAAQEFKEMLLATESQLDLKIDAAKLELSEQIYNAMEEAGLSEAELARRMDVSRAYVNKILKGTANLTIESLVRIGIAMGREFGFQFRKVADTRVRSGKKLRTSASRRIGVTKKNKDRSIGRIPII